MTTTLTTTPCVRKQDFKLPCEIRTMDKPTLPAIYNRVVMPPRHADCFRPESHEPVSPRLMDDEECAELLYTPGTPYTPTSGRPGKDETPPYTPFLAPGRRDDYYQRYLDLSQNVAQKHPNPGPPVTRRGNVGANWRHIKEVQGYKSRVLYVDGLVRLYDKSGTNRELRPRRLTPQSAAVLSTPLGGDCRNYMRETTQTPASARAQTSPQSLILPGSPAKYKGFYKY